MTINLDTLRKTAEAATPGPWTRDGVGVLGAREDWDGGKGPARIMKAMMPWRTERMEANAEHVATFNPETVLALLSRVEKAERSCRLLGTIIERDGKNLVELTNSQDIIPEDGDGDWEVVWERAQEMKVRLEQAEQAVVRVREMSAHRKEIRLDYVDLIDLDRALDGDGRRLADDALGGDNNGGDQV